MSFATTLLLAMVGAQAAPPCEVPSATVCVLGGDDAGTGVAWASATLELETLLVLTHPRDLGGDPASFYNDGIGPSSGSHLRYKSAGGLNYIVETSGQTNLGPGATWTFLRNLFTSAPLNHSLSMMTGWIAKPRSGEVDEDSEAVKALTLLNRDGQECRVECKYVVDGTPEGYGLAAFELPIVFGREARNASPEARSDPTSFNETYAGRRTFTVNRSDLGVRTPVLEWSDPNAETEDVSSTSSPITTICEYVKKPSAKALSTVASDAPWLLTRPPAGYNASLFIDMDTIEAQAVCGNEGGFTCNRFEGIETIRMMHLAGCTGPAYPAWFHTRGDPITRGIPDTDTSHYLRASYANASSLWELKRRVERRAFLYPVSAMWHLQNFVSGGKRYGFCNTSYPSPIPAPYMTSDFDTTTHGGDAGVGGRLYHRVLARLASLEPVGGQLVYDGSPLRHAPTEGAASTRDAQEVTTGSTVHKSYWEPESVTMPLYGTDWTKGVLGGSVTLPDPRSNGDGVLFGNGPDVGNFHGLHRRILFPDPNFPATPALLTEALALKAQQRGGGGAGTYPPVGNYSRTFVANLLSPGSPRSSFVLQNAQRIGCGANAMGVAAASFIAVAERLNQQAQEQEQEQEPEQAQSAARWSESNKSKPVAAHEVPTLLVQWVLSRELGTAFTFYSPESFPWNGNESYTNPSFAAGQIAGAFAVPRDLMVDEKALRMPLSEADLTDMLASYSSGMVNGTIPPSPSPPPSFTCEGRLSNGSWYAFVPDWTLVNDHGRGVEAIVSRGNTEGHACEGKGALLKQCTQVSTQLPSSAVRCVPSNTTLGLAVPAEPFTSQYWIVRPKRPVQAAPQSTRAGLIRALDAILAGSGSEVIEQPVAEPSAAVTLAELQEVVTRHAALWRSRDLQLDLLGFMGLGPFAFPS